MKIIREINGEQVEIELTDKELRLSYEEYVRECRKQDIYSQFEDIDKQHFQDFIDTITARDLDMMCDEVEHNIDHCDPYFDAYWGCVAPVVDKYVESHGVVDD